MWAQCSCDAHQASNLQETALSLFRQGRIVAWLTARLHTLFHAPAWNSYCLVGSLASSAALRLQPNAAGARRCPPEARAGGASGLGTAESRLPSRGKQGMSSGGKHEMHARQLSSRLALTGWHQCSCRRAWWARCRRAAAAAGCREGAGKIRSSQKGREFASPAAGQADKHGGVGKRGGVPGSCRLADRHS